MRLQDIIHEFSILAYKVNQHKSRVTLPELFWCLQSPSICCKHATTILRCRKYLPLPIGEHILIDFKDSINVRLKCTAIARSLPTHYSSFSGKSICATMDFLLTLDLALSVSDLVALAGGGSEDFLSFLSNSTASQYTLPQSSVY